MFAFLPGAFTASWPVMALPPKLSSLGAPAAPETGLMELFHPSTMPNLASSVSLNL